MAWVEARRPWYRTEIEYCDVTGQLLPRRYWTFEHGGRTLKARDPRAEELYRRYVVSRHGGRAAS